MVSELVERKQKKKKIRMKKNHTISLQHSFCLAHAFMVWQYLNLSQALSSYCDLVLICRFLKNLSVDPFLEY